MYAAPDRSSVSEASTKADSGSIGTASTSQSYLRRKYSWSRYKWKNNWEYLIITLASTTTIGTLYTFSVQHGGNELNFIQYVIMLGIVGLPLCYMEVVLGHYSQLGVTLFKYLTPIGHGLGYTMVINAMIRCIYYGIVMADSMLYLLGSMQRELQWMNCPENSEKYCWGVNNMKNCTLDCINDRVQVSAYVYWTEVFMNNVTLVEGSMTFGPPIFPRVVTMGIAWASVYVLVSLGINKYKQVALYSFYLLITFLTILLLVCMVQDGGVHGMSHIFALDLEAFANTHVWAQSVSDVVELLALDRVCHVTYGSYMAANAKSDILAIAVVILNFIASFMGGLITHAAVGILANKSKSSIKVAMHLWPYGTLKYFVLIPQALGFLGGPHIWTIIYFLTSIILMLNNQVAQMDSIERCIADAHPFIRNYRNYVVAALCSLGMLIGTMYTAKEAMLPLDEIYYCALRSAKILDLALMCIFIFWVYTVQRLSDDIHFSFGHQPTKYWKFCWYLTPAIVGGTNIYITILNSMTANHTDYFVITHYTIYFIAISPILILAVVEIFIHLRRHDLVGLIQPQERWGPPDPQERHYRHVFNPRMEIRSRRRNDTCQHNCLLGHGIVKIAVEAEKRYWQHSDGIEVVLSSSSGFEIPYG